MKNHNIEDGFIHLNGEIAERKRMQARVKDAKKNGTERELTAEEDETLDELKARLAARSKTDENGDMVKSLRVTVSNFLRRRKRRPELMARSLRHDQRLVLPTGKQKVTSELFLKAADAFNKGVISGIEFNAIDLCRRTNQPLTDEALLKKVRG